MPPTTRSMVANGVVAPKEYAVRPKKAKKPQPEPDPNLTKHGQICFDRKGLQIGGALESDTAKPPTLANEVLKLYRKENVVQRRRGSPGNPIRWEIELSDPVYWGLEDPDFHVPDIFDCITHHFRFQPMSHAWAETRSQSVPHSPDEETLLDVCFTSVTFLHKDFLHLSYTDFPKATKSQQLRFLYFLAVTVAHEMAHLMWQHNWARNQANRWDNTETVLDWEPYFDDYHWGENHRDNRSYPPRSDFFHNELGIVWRRFMFGGRIQPLNQSLSPFVPDGLVVLPMDMVRHTYFWDPQCRVAALRTRWISDQFSEAWWQRKGKRGTLARRPGLPRLAPVRATVNRTIDSSVFQDNEYDIGGEAQQVVEHVLGGSPGHRVVESIDDTWLLIGVVRSFWVNPDMISITDSEP
ncbi:hypothetical protein MMC22_011790 [Lobaria immixta]|nr:hypothetical protein [Lobaria immixta]